MPIVNRFCFDSRLGTAAIALAAKQGPATKTLQRISGKLPQGLIGGERWVGSVHSSSGREFWATGENQAFGTAAATAIGLEKLGVAETGSHQLHQLTSIAEVAPGLQSLGISGDFGAR